jgi:hypothetical protein
MVKVMVDFGVRGPLQELALGRLTLNRRAHRWQDHRWPRLATPAHKCCCCRRSAALQGCCNCAAELCKAIFCCQVFFDYDPSSSTSLLSSAMGQTKAKNRNGEP